MRLHALALEAFGPYAGRQEVDFDELTDAGVFLLTGPTGAGKTSVLDAVCFALYGVVPGDREVRGLRSAHASPEVPTRVELELTLCGRRLRITRWPEWQRPKRRGQGTTTERAGARLLEIDPDGAERLVSARVQEVGHELGPLLGMTSDQFMQVVLLPQGGFSTFLKADSDQRRDVLERLFATHRFTRIEAWVHERASVLRRAEERARSELLELVAAAAHRAGLARPDSLDEAALQQWRAGVLAQAQAEVEAATALEQQARARCEQAQAAQRRAEATRTLLQRRTRAESELRSLDETEQAAHEARERLSDHRRAAAVAPLLGPLDDAREQLTRAATRAEQARVRLPETTDRPSCEREAARLQRRIGELTGLEPLAARVDDARRLAERLRTEVARAADELARRTRDHETLPGRRAGLGAQLDEARVVAARRDERQRVAQSAARRREAADELPVARRAVGELTELAHDAHERWNDARQHHLDLVERRLGEMAAELAGALEPGAACQVCGSTEHPAPAPATPDAVTREQQAAAEAATRQARSELDEAQHRLTQSERRVGVLEQASEGCEPDEARLAELAAHDELRRAEAAQARVADLQEQLRTVDEQVQHAGRLVEEAREQHGLLARELEGAERLVAESEPQLRAARGDEVSLAAALGSAHERLALVEQTHQVLVALDDAEVAHESWQRRAEQALVGTGFTHLDQARAAVLAPADEVALSAVVQERRELRARAEAVLADPDVRELGDLDAWQGETVLASAGARAAQAATALQEAVSTLRGAQSAAAALVGLDDQISTAVAAWAPAREGHELADSMSRLVRGMGSDNHLQMRLSSYVLATRLDQVLDAANERLQQMRDNRYTVHRSGRTRAGRRSGLDLDVLDDWTGELRPPSTLSGGETFKISLALALGLADVITHEAGGLEIETLFIDEGFGMLDPDTLDEVMDCVDDLRNGGRSVGVVSHVTELRSRVATQLHVTPSPEGSRIQVATAAV